VAQARTLVKLASEAELQKLTEPELHSVGLRRSTSDHSQVEPVESTRPSAAPVVSVDASGRAVIRQEALENLKEQFPETAKLVQMRQRRARSQASERSSHENCQGRKKVTTHSRRRQLFRKK
jgi:hypothetical protein